MRGGENEYVAHVLELLRRWAPVAARRMFGGYGIYRGDIMFALIADDTLHFKTSLQDVRIREIIKYTDYKRFGSNVKITYEGKEVEKAPQKSGNPDQKPQ